MADGSYTRDVFRGNIIPANRISRVASNVAPVWPLPNTTGNPLTHVNNYSTVEGGNNEHQMVTKIDHNLSSRYKVNLTRQATNAMTHATIAATAVIRSPGQAWSGPALRCRVLESILYRKREPQMAAALPSSPELSSWKEIAAYLHVSVKTAQLWERDRGLPVRRVPGSRAQVRASAAELDAWKASAPPNPPDESKVETPSPAASPVDRRWSALSICLLLAGMALAVRMVLHRPVLASVNVVHDALAGMDQTGKTLWNHSFGSLRAGAYTDGERRSWVGDIDGDGVPDVLFVPVPAGLVEESVPLVWLDHSGRERWRFTPGRTITNGHDTFAPPFVVRQFAVLGDKIIVTSHHHLYAPSQVAVLNAQGKLLREYWHPGHLNVLRTGTSGGKRMIFLGGINNDRHAATIVVLDPERLAGAAIEHGNPAFAGFSPGVKEARLLFPRSCLNKTDPYNEVVNIMPQQYGVIVDVHEELNDPHPASILYHLNQDFTLNDVALSDIFLSKHVMKGHAFTPRERGRLRTITRIR